MNDTISIDNGQILYAMPQYPVDLCFDMKKYMGYEIKGIKDFKKVKDE